ncbi:MAG: DUF4352 domain-containing protein [Thermomicrobiales bacterium]
MLVRRYLFAFMLVFGLTAGTLTAAFAGGAPVQSGLSAAQQDDDATPEADDNSTSNRDDATSGAAVEVFDESGDPTISIAISNVDDDFQDYSEYSAPDRGFHYVYFEVTVENIGDRAAEVSSYDFFVRDDQGFLYGSSYFSVLEDSPTSELVEFNPEDPIEAGDSYTGYLVFLVPDVSELVDAFYAPSGRLITIGEFDS